jgi:hypothetical protein
MNPHLTKGDFYSVYVEESAVTLRIEAEGYSGHGRFLSTQKDYDSACNFALNLAKNKRIGFSNDIDPSSNWQPAIS